MASLRPTTKIAQIKIEAQREIVKLTAVALTLLLAMTAITQLMNFNANASSGTGLTAMYFDNIDFSNPKLTRQDDSVDFDWDSNSPESTIASDTYSARWVGSVVPRYSDTYNFYTFSDDGVRLWIDGKLVIDNWTDHPRTENIGYMKLEAGKKYALKLEYFENTGRSVMQLSWSSKQQPKEIIPKSQLFPTQPETVAAATTTANTVQAFSDSVGSIKGEYFDKIDLSGSKITRMDKKINFDWGDRSPDAKIAADTFSVRWTGQITPQSTERYTFYTLSDDGIRLWVNNQVIIDNWSDHPLSENNGSIELQKGQAYSIKMEYYERYGRSAASLSWSSPSLAKQTIGESYFNPSINNPEPVISPVAPAPAPAPQPTPAPAPAPAPTPTAAPAPSPSLGSTEFYVNPHSQAQNWVNNNRHRSYEASLVEKIAQQPTAQWLGGWNWNLYEDVKKTVSNAASQGKTAIFVAYNIPQRDCGGYSSGGTGSYDAYYSWIGTIAAAIGNNKALVVLEPDALSLMDCLSSSDKDMRMNALKGAVSILKKNSNTSVYLDAGHSGWLATDEMSARLNKAGIAQANGFALNTSNFHSTSDTINYGQQISGKVGGKKFVIDTSRNGKGATADSQWCNPWGRALGQKPTTNTGNGSVDAYIWVKAPGESDGNCNGGPKAGAFWPEYAIDLVKNAGW